MKKTKFKAMYLLPLLVLMVFSSCSDDQLNPTLAQDLTVETSVNKYEDLRLLLNGAYDFASNYRYQGRNAIIFGEVRADNVFANANSGRFIDVAQMKMTVNNGDASDFYRYAYKVIANANVVIGASGVTGDESLIKHAKGEALALRALSHFDLLKVFGQQHVAGQGGLNAPGIIYTKEFKGSDLFPSRSTVAEVKKFIYDDLDAALGLMSASLNDGSKFSITTDAVYAIKSRVATYFGDADIAKVACEAIINKYSIVSRDVFSSTYLPGNAAPNSIFELAQYPVDNNGINGLANIYTGPAYGDIQVLDQFVADAGFDSDDIRSSSTMIRTVSGKVRNVGKYPTLGAGAYADNIKIIRYEEVVLNYAESLLASNPAEALKQLNRIVSNRETTPNLYTAATLDNILAERRKELCFEGFRFDDLARTGKKIPVINSVAQTHGGPAYGSYNFAFPIPQVEINANINVKQNFGYN